MAKILLVEDDADLSDTLKDWLECINYTVEAAYTGPVALSKMNADRYDVIILDWQLPDLLGVDVLRQYRLAGGQDKVVMLTGHRDVSTRQTGLDAGADDFLGKPFTLDQLSKKLEEILSRC